MTQKNNFLSSWLKPCQHKRQSYNPTSYAEDYQQVWQMCSLNLRSHRTRPAACCVVSLQHVATCCNIPQCAATHHTTEEPMRHRPVGLRASGKLPVTYVLTGNLLVTYHQ